MIDDELKDLAALALRNAFWFEFSSLVNNYLAASKGLDDKYQELQLGELTSIYGRKYDHVNETQAPTISTLDAHGLTTTYKKLLDALNDRFAISISINGKLVFRQSENGWMFED